MNTRLTGKVAIVTGATSGIGREVAVQLAAQGAMVAAAGRRNERGEQLVCEIRRAGGDAIYVQTDVRDGQSVANLVAQTLRRYGRIDLAFNNAGVPGDHLKLTADHDDASWNAVIDTNLKGIWLCMKHQIPQMLKLGGGAIVNTASYLGLVGAEFGVSPYVASKHGVIGLSRTAALEYARKGIRVNTLCPGMTRTAMLDPALEGPGKASFEAFVDTAIPMGRVAEPDEIASAVLWLLSDDASYVTGQTLVVDGGIIAR